MSENESISSSTSQRTDTELVSLISDGVNRDLRRYPCRFNSENE